MTRYRIEIPADIKLLVHCPDCAATLTLIERPAAHAPDPGILHLQCRNCAHVFPVHVPHGIQSTAVATGGEVVDRTPD